MKNIYDFIIHDYKPAMGQRLRACRLQSNYTQEYMAEVLDISLKHYSEIERGITGLSTEKLIYLSNFFQISIDYLLKGDEPATTVPFALIELYQTCPPEKKTYLIDFIKNLKELIKEPNSN